jgi:hypothetical protein
MLSQLTCENNIRSASVAITSEEGGPATAESYSRTAKELAKELVKELAKEPAKSGPAIAQFRRRNDACAFPAGGRRGLCMPVRRSAII